MQDSLIVFPIFENNTVSHYKSQISYFIIFDLDKNISLLNINNSDVVFKGSLSELDNKIIYTLESKKLINLGFKNVIDINLLLYCNSLPIIEYTLTDRNFISEHINYIRENVLDKCITNINLPTNDSFHFYKNTVLPTICKIEKSGMFVNRTMFDSIFPDKNQFISNESFVYTDYHLYTTTGRPSNSFNGINFNGLNKKTERECFVSRYDGGVLAELDYSSSHLNLIAMCINYPTKVRNWHEYLGKQYFNVDELSIEQYDAAKKLNFEMMYGKIKEEYLYIPFLKMVQEFKDKLIYTYKQNGFIETYKGRKIYNINESHKIFNYFIQSLEFEILMEILYSCEETDTAHLILYVYDSILFDTELTEKNIIFIKNIKKHLENFENFYINIHVGTTYKF